MKSDWEKLYRSVLMERDPTLKQLRAEKAHKAVTSRIKETDDNGERQRLNRALEMLNLLRNRS
jgi:hypothetical protein